MNLRLILLVNGQCTECRDPTGRYFIENSAAKIYVLIGTHTCSIIGLPYSDNFLFFQLPVKPDYDNMPFVKVKDD